MTFTTKDLDREHCALACAPEELFLNSQNEPETKLIYYRIYCRIDIISYPGVDIKLTSKTEASEDNINDSGLMVCSVDNCAPKDAI